MKVPSPGRIPRSYGSLEDHSIARVQEHLGRAAGRSRVRVLVIPLEHQTYVADAIPDASNLPRAPTGLIEGCCRDAPGDVRLKWVEIALRSVEVIAKVVVSDSAIFVV